MTTINAYSVSLALDADNYIRNSSLSRKETSSLRREINMARTPADNYERSVTRIEKALQAGAIDQKVYNRLMAEAKNRLDRASKSASSTATAFGSIKTSLAGFAASVVGIQTMRRAFQELREEMQLVDSIAKSARGMSITTTDLEALQFAAAEFAGVEGPQFVSLLGRLQRRVGEASLGMGEARKAFQMLGLDAEQLSLEDAAAQFDAVQKAIAKIDNPTQQAAIALKIFDSEGKQLLPMLKDSKASLEAYRQQMVDFNLTMDQKQIQNIEAFNDSIGRLDKSLQGLKRTVLGSEKMVDIMTTIANTGANMVTGLRFAMLDDRLRPSAPARDLIGKAFNAIAGPPEKKPSDVVPKIEFDSEKFTSSVSNLWDAVGSFGEAVAEDFQARREIQEQSKISFEKFMDFFGSQRNEGQQLSDALFGKVQQRTEDMDALAPSAARGSQEAYKIITQARNAHEQKIEQLNQTQNKHLADLSQMAGRQLAELMRLVPVEVM